MLNKLSRSSKLRLLRCFALTAVTVLVIAVGTLRIQQWVLRQRAERLLADIQQIELRKTSFEGAQKQFARWGEWGRAESIACSRLR